MKTVFSNRELAHVWAQQSQQHGKGSRMFFEGKTIYSYGMHFKIAEFVDSNTVLLNSQSYSHSTAKHQHYVRYALDYDKLNIIHVPDLAHGFTRNCNLYVKKIAENLTKASTARSKTDVYLSQVNSLADNLCRYVDAIKPDFIIPEALQVIEKFKAGNLVSTEVLQQYKEREQVRREKEIEKNKEKIQKWLNGENVHLDRLDSVFLRMNGDDVETSLGAKVPVNEAKILLAMMRNNKPVHGFKIGYYTTQSFDGKVLKIGCHKLCTGEINRFAAANNW